MRLPYVVHMRNCSMCQGTRIQRRRATISLGGKLTQVIVYDAECPRCEAAERYLTGGPKNPPGFLG